MRYRAALCLLGVSLAQAFIIPVMGGLLPSPKINGTIVAKDPSGGSILCYLVSGACVTEASDAYTFTADLSISGPQNVPCADPLSGWNLNIQQAEVSVPGAFQPGSYTEIGQFSVGNVHDPPSTPSENDRNESGVWVLGSGLQITAVWTNPDGSSIDLGFYYDGITLAASPNVTGWCETQNAEEGEDYVNVVDVYYIPQGCEGMDLQNPELLELCLLLSFI